MYYREATVILLQTDQQSSKQFWGKGKVIENNLLNNMYTAITEQCFSFFIFHVWALVDYEFLH